MKRFHSHNAYTNYDGYWFTLQSYNTAVVKANEILLRRTTLEHIHIT
jgi:hypothetical protein